MDRYLEVIDVEPSTLAPYVALHRPAHPSTARRAPGRTDRCRGARLVLRSTPHVPRRLPRRQEPGRPSHDLARTRMPRRQASPAPGRTTAPRSDAGRRVPAASCAGRSPPRRSGRSTGSCRARSAVPCGGDGSTETPSITPSHPPRRPRTRSHPPLRSRAAGQRGMEGPGLGDAGLARDDDGRPARRVVRPAMVNGRSGQRDDRPRTRAIGQIGAKRGRRTPRRTSNGASRSMPRRLLCSKSTSHAAGARASRSASLCAPRRIRLLARARRLDAPRCPTR